MSLLMTGCGKKRVASCGRGQCCSAALFELGIFPQQTEAQSLLAVEPHPEGREGRVAVGSRAGRKQTQGEEADFQDFTVRGLPGEPGPVLIFTRCPGNQSSEVRGERGSRSPNMA